MEPSFIRNFNLAPAGTSTVSAMCTASPNLSAARLPSDSMKHWPPIPTTLPAGVADLAGPNESSTSTIPSKALVSNFDMIIPRPVDLPNPVSRAKRHDKPAAW